MHGFVKLIEEYILDGDVTAAINEALNADLGAQSILTAIDGRLTDNTVDMYFAFAAGWFTRASTFDRPHIANWLGRVSILEGSHIPQVRLIAAQSLLQAQDDILNWVAESSHEAWVFADGPDAGICRAEAKEIAARGAQIAALAPVQLKPTPSV